MSEDKADAQVVTPGGLWTDRHPSFNRTLNSLFRRSFLVKIRDAGTIVSEIIATVIICILIVFWHVAENPQDAITKTDLMTSDGLFDNAVVQIQKLVQLGRGGNFVAGPKNSTTLHRMLAGTWGKQLIPILDLGMYAKTGDVNKSAKSWVNISENFTYVDSMAEIKDDFDHHDTFSNAIWWDNYDNLTFWSNFTAHIYENQNLVMIFNRNVDAVAAFTFLVAGNITNSINGLVNLQIMKHPLLTQEQKRQLMLQPYGNTNFKVPNIFASKMERPKVTNEMPINMAVAFFSAIPMVLASMPDLSMVLNDKESHMLTFIFLMGASEAAYWIVNIVSTFVMCFIPYLVMDILFSAWLAMAGTNFLILLILSILFILSYTQFQNFFSTFFTKAGTGRVLTVIFLILILFFGYLDEVYTLDAPKGVKHVFSLIPFVSYELAMSVMYEEVRNNRPAIGWSDVKRNNLKYPIWYAFMWLSLDIVIWGLLFLLFNATNDRGFGSPIIRWRDLFRCHLQVAPEIELENIRDEDSILKVEHLVKRYGSKTVNAVDDVSFDIKKGEIIVMIGPNGAGKSSILNVVSGAIPSTHGTLALGDKDPSTTFSGIQNCLGIVFQDNVIFRLLSIREHLEIFGRIRGIDEQTLQESIDFFADNLQLKEMLPNRAGDLSGGQKRKLCIAMALLGNPPIIMMDEPTAGVDVQARQLIWKAISNLKNSTCIITTHALEEAEAVSSRMFVVSRGQLKYAGTSTELRNNFKCGYVLKVDSEAEVMPNILEAVKKFVPEAAMLEERDDSITLPVSGEIPDLLSYLDDNKEKLGIEGYSFSVEQLEDVLMRIVEAN